MGLFQRSEYKAIMMWVVEHSLHHHPKGDHLDSIRGIGLAGWKESLPFIFCVPRGNICVRGTVAGEGSPLQNLFNFLDILIEIKDNTVVVDQGAPLTLVGDIFKQEMYSEKNMHFPLN